MEASKRQCMSVADEREGLVASSPSELTRLSKAMTKLLRHRPPAGTMDSEGWMDLPVLLKLLKGRPTDQVVTNGLTMHMVVSSPVSSPSTPYTMPPSVVLPSYPPPNMYQVVRMVVSSSDKQRFVIDESSEPPRIRATQGHSVPLDNPILTPVKSYQQLVDLLHPEDPSIPLTLVHVTGEEGWAAIQAAGELRRMARTHIHFATRPHMVRRNSWASIWLRLDLRGALEAGHSFHLATNEVLLSEGPLPVIFVDKMEEIEIERLPEEWRSIR